MFLLAACGTEFSEELTIEGPSRIQVDALGPVATPGLRLSDGTAPKGVAWRLSREGIVRLAGSQLVAEAPGEVDVVGSWQTQEVRFTLEVRVDAQLRFVRTPAELRVGETVGLRVDGRAGDQAIPAEAIAWTTSAPDVLSVDHGVAVGRDAGTAYVTAAAWGAEAMAELVVVP